MNGVTSTTKLIGMLDTRNCSSATVEKTMRKVYGYLTYFETGENTITATAKFTKPTSDITVTLEVI